MKKILSPITRLSGIGITLAAVMGMLTGSVWAQVTPSQDAYTDTSTPSSNLGTKTTLNIDSGSQTTFIQFDLASVPSGYTGANIAKASLKLYVNAITSAGSFNINFVNGSWLEKTITSNLSPAIGTTIAASVPLTGANVHDYVLIDVTAAVQAWLNGTEPNDGIALVGNSPLNASFDSKENTTNSHPPELDIVFVTAGKGSGTITGVTAGPGLTGGGTSGKVTLSLLTSCASGQVLEWSGSTWICATPGGSGTITGITAGTDLTGGGTSGKVTLNLDTTRVPQLTASNGFTNVQTIVASPAAGAAALSVTNTGTGGSYSIYSKSSATYNLWASGGQYGVVAYGQANPVVGQTVTGSQGVYGEADANSRVFGVEGVVAADSAAGVYGVNGSLSKMGSEIGSGTGVWGDAGSTGNSGVLGTADNPAAMVAINNSDNEPAMQAINYGGDRSNVLSPGVWGISLGGTGIGVVGTSGDNSATFEANVGFQDIGVVGDSNQIGGIGVAGTTDFGTSVFGKSDETGTGVFGQSAQGVGVYGVSLAPGTTTSNFSYGVWGSAAGPTDIGVYGSSTSGTAVQGISSTGEPTAYFLNQSSTDQTVLLASGAHGFCSTDTDGNLECSGSKSAVVPLADQRWVKLYAVESPENWFEDFGSGQLSGGSAVIALEPEFSETVNSSSSYHVFLTPSGDSQGLYVAAKTATFFEVREHGGGKSNISFDYRIVAHRKGYEGIRMEDVTGRENRRVSLREAVTKQPLSKSSPTKAIAGISRSHIPTPRLPRRGLKMPVPDRPALKLPGQTKLRMSGAAVAPAESAR